MKKARPVAAILLTLLFAILFLCAMAVAPLAAMAEPRGEIRVVESWRPDVNVLGHNVLQYLFEYAVDKNELAPSLATSRKWIDDTTLEIELRRGVRFHNGEPFDAHAVKFNVTFQRQHNLGRGVQVYMKNLKEIRIISSHTIQMVLSKPDALFLDKLILGPISGWVIGAPKYMAEVGWEEFLKRPVGTGPYMVAGEVKDYRVVPEGGIYATLVANPEYWQNGYPKIQKISFIKYSPKKALRALVEGRVDLVTSLIPKDTLKVAESQHSRVVKSRDDPITQGGILNLRSPHTAPLRDLRVRKALNYAVNKQELLKYAFKGNGIVTRGGLTEKSGIDLSDTQPYEWDIPKARELLREAGYKEGFKMKLFCQDKDYLTASLLQRFYSLLNIQMEITLVEWEWVPRHLAYPNIREGYSWDDEDWWIALVVEPGMWPEVACGMLEWNFHSGAAFQSVPDWLLLPLDRMYDEIHKTKGREKRFQIYKKAFEYIADYAFCVYTVAPFGLYGVNKELNFVPQVSQYLYLDYSSVTENHWSVRGKND